MNTHVKRIQNTLLCCSVSSDGEKIASIFVLMKNKIKMVAAIVEWQKLVMASCNL